MITVEFNRLKITPGFRILDIGCGNGRHTGAAYDLKNVIAIGADLNLNDLKTAAERLKWHEEMLDHGNGSWELISANITDLPFADHSFDLVICSEVLEHVPNHQKAVREILRVLKPGHDLVVSVPRYWPEWICWALSVQYRTTQGGHIRIYTRKQLENIIVKNGARTWAMHFAHALHSPFWWLKCLVGPDREDIPLINLYHRFLTWDLMQKPIITRFLEKLLNPLLGKSIVLYFRKNA
jgi:2-polyprenyl-3-methyl-5-hydroxy-6-metoxy-1,4-benzoquinol methylase